MSIILNILTTHTTHHYIKHLKLNVYFLNVKLLLQLMDEVCNQLYNFYRSRELDLQRFTLQFLPTLIYIYLNSAAHGDIKVRLYFY